MTLMRDGERESRVAVQDYVKAIWTAGGAGDGGVSTGAIAAQLGVTAPSVSAMIRRLEVDGLIDREPYRGVTLTARGRLLALEVVRHHRLLETFLARSLGMPWDRIHAEAEVLEHHISEELEELIDHHLGHPEFDPHGHPIPRRDGTIPTIRLRTLVDLDAGAAGTVAQVRDDSAEVLRYLAEHGLVVGATLEVLDAAPIAGTITVRVGDAEPVVLGTPLARRIDLDGGPA